jgi:putative transposase
MFAFLPRVSRSITRQGVILNHVRYYEAWLEPLFDTGQRRIEVAYDPRDLSQLFVETAQGIRTLRYRNLARPPMTLWDLRSSRRRLAAEGRKQVDEEALFAAREANAELIDGATQKSRSARREAVRRQRHQAQAQSVPVIEELVSPAPPDEDAPDILASGFVVEIEPW